MTRGGPGRLGRALAATLLVCCFATAGCGGGEEGGAGSADDPPATLPPDPVAAYAKDVRRVIRLATEEAAKAGRHVNAAGSSDELAFAVGEFEAVMSVAAENYRGLEPPRELRDLNDRFIRLHQSYAEQTATTRGAIEQGDTKVVRGFQKASRTYASELGLLAQELDAAAAES